MASITVALGQRVTWYITLESGVLVLRVHYYIKDKTIYKRVYQNHAYKSDRSRGVHGESFLPLHHPNLGQLNDLHYNMIVSCLATTTTSQ